MQLAEIHLTRIRPPKFLLRPVRQNSVEYAELLDSIRDNGLWQPILVRPCEPNEYEIVEGHWRYTCCKQLRWETMPCFIRELTDARVLVAQLQANGIRPETTPVEYARRLERLLKASPDMTVSRLSKLIRKSPTWIREMLQLNSLKTEYRKMVIRGEIPVSSATLLARMPHSLQDQYVDLASTLSVGDFKPIAQAASKHFREAAQRRFINDHRVNRPDPVPHLRKFLDIRSEYENPTVGGLVLHQCKAETPYDGWRACLAWILHLDADSLKRQTEMFEKRHRQREAELERRKLERQRLRELRESGEEPFLETE